MLGLASLGRHLLPATISWGCLAAGAILLPLRRKAILAALLQHHLMNMLPFSGMNALRGTCRGLASSELQHAAAVVFPTLAMPVAHAGRGAAASPRNAEVGLA